MSQQLHAHQLRVIEELRELQERITKLRLFINLSGVFQSLDLSEQRRLTRQSVVMEQYASILQERIDAWGPHKND